VGRREGVTEAHTHRTILPSVSGLGQIHCEFGPELPGLKTKTFPAFLKRFKSLTPGIIDEVSFLTIPRPKFNGLYTSTK
jgi:hypothetical protein